MAREKITLFGWCSTGHHDECIKVLPSFADIICQCECHTKSSKPKPAISNKIKK